jgi:hypothetical protein
MSSCPSKQVGEGALRLALQGLSSDTPPNDRLQADGEFDAVVPVMYLRSGLE